jgi:ABC-2 type transport system permease protein/sodium transport system permease protein
VDLGLRTHPPGPFEARPDRALAVDCELLYRDDSAAGLEAARYVQRLCAAANARFLGARLRELRVRQRLVPVRAQPVALRSPVPKRATMLAALVPLILILMTITGAVYPAIDLTAGERERGTLEILVAAPIPRLSLLLAKYVAVLTVAMLTALVNLGTMAGTLLVTGVGQMLFGAGPSAAVLAQVLALLLLFAAFFSAVLLALTSFARSFKEAQAYLIPLMLLALMPGMLSLMPGLRLNVPLAVTPLLNIVLLTRDLFEGTANPALAAVVVLTTLLYALAAVGLAARVFGAEAVLYSQHGGWGELFRRPRGPRPVPAPSAALLCLALMFPASFLLNHAPARLGPWPPGPRLAWSAAASLLLFGGVPLLSAWLGRVRLATALRLARPGWQGCAAALLLGLCLWPWAHEVILLQRWAGFATLGQEHLEQVRKELEQWRTLPPVVFVLGLAVVPAVVEELFFRGYLFTALSSAARPWPAVLGSAALFGLFHLLGAGALTVERFLPSALLGVVLGWVCWRTGSVVPGILLHAAHNGLLVLLAYYEPRLAERGWQASAEAHLPAGLLLASALGAALGAAWVKWSAVRDEPLAPAEGA